MRLAIAALLVASMAAAGERDGTATFSTPKDKAYAAAITAIAADSIRIDQANAETGFISYTKWFSKSFGVKVDISVSLLAVESGTKVIVATPNGGLRKKTLRAIADEMFRQGLIPESEVPKS